MPSYKLDNRPAWSGATINVRGPLLHVPVDQPVDQTQQYGVGKCLQVSPHQIAVLTNRRVTNQAITDYENGWDVIVVDDISQINESGAKSVVTNTRETHPRTGQQLVMVQHLPIGGFVPLGAKLQDGRPHPHAGTGFGLAVIHGYPADNSLADAHVAKDMHHYMALFQFAFDGENFSVTDMEPLRNDEVLPGYWVYNRGLGTAIHDGEDMLSGLVAGRDDQLARAHAERLKNAGREPYLAAKDPVGECYGSGISRWRRGPNGWRPVTFTPVPKAGPDMGFEPSIVRDHDNSLLMTIRGKGANVPPGESDCGLENTYEHFQVYRSTDNGESWHSVIHQPEMRAPTPTSIVRAADGTVFIAANPFRPLEKDSKGRVVMKQRQRDQLWLWPLTDDRSGVGEPFVILNCTETFGPPRQNDAESHDNRWFADHPVGGVFRLADGKLHTLIGFRVSDAATTSGGAGAATPSGAWIAEIHTEGEGICDWKF